MPEDLEREWDIYFLLMLFVSALCFVQADSILMNQNQVWAKLGAEQGGGSDRLQNKQLEGSKVTKAGSH